jgi:hypothetical protein
VDDFSRFTWVFMLKSKAQVPDCIKKFIAISERHFDAVINSIHSNNGTEFKIDDYLGLKGIEHQRSCVETPQQNGRVERKHQHILNVARALLMQSKLPKKLWNYIVCYAVYIINRVPTPVLDNKVPYELLFGKLPYYTMLKVFGSLCYISTHNAQRKKFDSRAQKCAFLGYIPRMKGYAGYDVHDGSISISRHVKFHETVFSYAPDSSRDCAYILTLG